MDHSGSSLVDILEIYRRFCDIRMRGDSKSREMLAQLMKLVELRWQASSVFDDLAKLMSHLELTVDSCRFTCFYDFVFFLCRERGQKNITVAKAVTAWRLVLTGRFRLLNEWCNFVEKHQRYNISEDTWQQVLAFSRCVHEDLEGYDPKGAWPVIIDDFVEHMHRVTLSNSCSTRTCSCNCGDPEAQACTPDDGFPGLKVFSGLKRKSITSFGRHEVESSNSLYANSWSFDPLFSSKKNRQSNLDDKPEPWETRATGDDGTDDYMEIVKHGSPLGSACTVEGSLSEGFAGLLSTGSCLQVNQKRQVPYT